MSSNRSSKHSKTEGVEYNRTAQSIFATAESMGITDRTRTEELVKEVILRLEKNRRGGVLPLPGMEALVPKFWETSPSLSEIQKLVNEIVAEVKLSDEPVAQSIPVKSAVAIDKNAPTSLIMQMGITTKTVLEKRYLGKDRQGNVIETIEDMFRRVAHNIASAEKKFSSKAKIKAWEDKFYDIMTKLEFLPNSPTLMNAGRELQQLSACFVLPVEDSMESIFDAVKYTALIHKSGGGTGFSFSRLRPENDPVGSTGGVASGPVSFMRAFDTATDVIKQGGTRRGANMAILNINHPDIMKFINAKEKSDAFNNFNLSVALTEEFMSAVERGMDYDLVNPASGKIVGTCNARDVFNTIVDMAWRTGDPGIIFIDRINSDNPTPHLGRIESTNPCGEQPLLPYESCNLGSINLSKVVYDGCVDWDKLAEITKIAVRFLDNVIEMNKYPLSKIEEMTKQTRKIGLGVMGFADMLIKLGIPYDSDKAIQTAEDVMRFVDEAAVEASVELAQERGVFPAFKGSVYDGAKGLKVRNATRTTIAPTGTLSIIAGCSSGIEPNFALSYTRTILDGDQFIEVNPMFKEVAELEGFYSDDLIKELSRKGSTRDIEGIPDDVKRLFVTSHDITPEFHIKMQAAFQKYTNNAVSKTVNFSHSATREDVARVYTLAYKEGCKGVTIYRDRSREQQVLALSCEDETVPEEKHLVPRERPRFTMGVTDRVASGCGSIYVTVNSDDQGICEVFTHLGKAGGCAAAQLEAIGRLISLALRSGVNVESIVKHLRGIRCPAIAWEDGHSILSCPDAIGSVLEKHIGDKPLNIKELCEQVAEVEQHVSTKKQSNGSEMSNVAGQCPECSGMLVYQEGCLYCPFCGYSKC